MIKLKSILAENMLRFGTKNLTESNKKNILLEQKLYTGEPSGTYKLNPPSKERPWWEADYNGGAETWYSSDTGGRAFELGGPTYKSGMPAEAEAALLKNPAGLAWSKRNPGYINWLNTQSQEDRFEARGEYEFNLLKKDYDINVKWRDKQLKTPDPAYAGIASKIVGMIMKALGGADDEQGILTALQMIRKNGGLPVYGNMLQLVKTSPNVKNQFKRNFNTVTDMIYNGGVQAPGYDKDQAAGRSHPLSGLGLGITDQEWTRKYAAILSYYNPKEGNFNAPASY